MMGRHSRRVPGAATLPPQVAILERDTFQTDTFGAGGCKVGTRHVPKWNTRVGKAGLLCMPDSLSQFRVQ